MSVPTKALTEPALATTVNEYLPAEDEAPATVLPKPTRGWFRAVRFAEMPQLVRTSRTAFILAYALAFRARWNPEAFNPYKLELGEAVCDYNNWGLSEQEFRNARDRLKAWGLATFRATSKGTIGRLANTRLFSIFASEANEPTNERSNGQRTTGATDAQRHTKKGKSKRAGGASPPSALLRMADWQLTADRERNKKQIRELEDLGSNDAPLLRGLRRQLKEVNDEIRRRGGDAVSNKPPSKAAPVTTLHAINAFLNLCHSSIPFLKSFVLHSGIRQ